MTELLKEMISGIDLDYTMHFHGVDEERFDELVDEDTKADLIDGVMIVHSPASIRQDDVGGFLVSLLRLFAEQNDLGRILGPDSMFRPAPGRRFAPDAYFILRENQPDPFPEDLFDGTPDLVIEILSPSNRSADLDDKRPAYRQAGVSEIWFVDKDNQEIIVDRRRNTRYTTKKVNSGRLQSEVIRDFWIDASWLWQEPLPKVLPTLNRIMGEETRNTP